MSGTTLRIKSFQITDDLSQRAASAKVNVAPTEKHDQPPVEFSGYGDRAALSGLTIRPNGITLTMLASYDNVPPHAIFRGLLEYMDDTEDANADSFNLQLSSMPIKQPHRIPVTQVFNSYYTDKANVTTSHDILASICRSAGLAIGRNDLPEYAIEGTWEVIHSTAVEEAGRLVNVFNLFEFKHYYVRTDADGLQIIGVDFSQEPSGNPYVLQNIISVKRHFELYMPDKRLGDLPVILDGADIMGYSSDEPRPTDNGGPPPGDRTPPDGQPSQGQCVLPFTKTITSTSSSQNTNNIANFDTWTESTTVMDVSFEVIGENLRIRTFDFTTSEIVQVYQYAIPSLESILDDSLKDPLTVVTFFNGQELLTWTVRITSLRVVDTKLISKLEEGYDSINGRVRAAKTTYEYVDAPADVANTGSQFHVNLPAQRLLTQEATEETIYPNGFTFLKSRTVVTHNYGDLREHKGSVTQKYLAYRGLLDLFESTTEVPDSFGLTNAQIQAFLSGRAPNPAAPDIAFGDTGIPPHPDPFPAPTTQLPINSRKETIGQYQLLNGTKIPLYPTLSMYKVLDLAKVDFEHSIAFHISCPGMNYTGLAAIWQLCLQQERLEHSNTYWEVVTVSCPIDSVPVVGSEANAAGTLGYVTAVEHIGDDNSALSLITIRRLHIG